MPVSNQAVLNHEFASGIAEQYTPAVPHERGDPFTPEVCDIHLYNLLLNIAYESHIARLDAIAFEHSVDDTPVDELEATVTELIPSELDTRVIELNCTSELRGG